MDEFDELIDFEESLGEPNECSSGQYVIGTVYLQKPCDLILDHRIDIRIFYRFHYPLVEEWAFTPYYDPNYHFSDTLEIIQVIIKDDVYTAVIKTYWLRVFQRAWRRLYRERKQWVESVKKNILFFMTHRSLGIQRVPTWM